MEVSRNVTCMDLPSISACGGMVVTRPSQEPVRVFSLSKDFCASDFGASDWAKVAVESEIKTALSTKRRAFMFISPQNFLNEEVR
jgi:hypothetical protein